jgi:ATP-dependent Clp protease ATP-binding subunit ClpB
LGGVRRGATRLYYAGVLERGECRSAAQALTQRNGQPEIGTLHLLQALVEQPQGVVPHLLGRMGVDARALVGATTIELDRLPKVAGAGEPGVSRALRDTVLAAHEEIAQFGDQFVSTEHLLLALLGHGDAKTQAMLADAKVTRDRILKALQDFRGSQRVTTTAIGWPCMGPSGGI